MFMISAFPEEPVESLLCMMFVHPPLAACYMDCHCNSSSSNSSIGRPFIASRPPLERAHTRERTLIAPDMLYAWQFAPTPVSLTKFSVLDNQAAMSLKNSHRLKP